MAEDVTKRSFEEEWPGLARRLGSALAYRRFPPWVRDDIVQETGLRLLRAWDRVDPNRSTWGLTLTIANNLLWDQTRRQPRREVLGDVPDRSDGYDIEQAGLARVQLDEVKRALPHLSPAHRSVLLAEIGDSEPPPSPTRDALKMLRMRARRNLSALIDKASALGAVVMGEIRRHASTSTEAVRRTVGSAELQQAAMGGALAIAVILVPLQFIPDASAETRIQDWASAGGLPVLLSDLQPAATRGTRGASDPAASNAPQSAVKRSVAALREQVHYYAFSLGADEMPGDGRATISIRPQSGPSRELVSAPRCRQHVEGRERVRLVCRARAAYHEFTARVRAETSP